MYSPVWVWSYIFSSMSMIICTLQYEYDHIYSPISRTFMFCQRRYHFWASDFVAGKVDSNVVLKQFNSCKHEHHLRYTAFIRKLVSLNEITLQSLTCCHAGECGWSGFTETKGAGVIVNSCSINHSYIMDYVSFGFFQPRELCY